MINYFVSFGTITALMFIDIIVAMRAYYKSKKTWILVFGLYLTTSLCLQWSGLLYSMITHKSNHFIFNIANLAELSFFCWLFHTNLPKGDLLKLCNIISIAAISFSVINILFGQGFFLYNSYSFYMESAVVIIFCLIYFYYILKQNLIVLPFDIPMFWISSGLFFFFAGDITYFLLMDYIAALNLDPGAKAFRYISLVLDILQYSFFFVGFYRELRWKKTS